MAEASDQSRNDGIAVCPYRVIPKASSFDRCAHDAESVARCVVLDVVDDGHPRDTELEIHVARLKDLLVCHQGRKPIDGLRGGNHTDGPHHAPAFVAAEYQSQLSGLDEHEA